MDNGITNRARVAHHRFFNVDHVMQHHHVTRHITHDLCIPCAKEENRTSVGKFLWTAVKSESFLVIMTIITLLLGVLAGSVDIEGYDIFPILELAHFLTSTFLAMIIILIRIISGRMTFMNIKQNVKTNCAKMGDFTEDELTDMVPDMWYHLYAIVGTTLLALIAACFIIFYFLSRLMWTILTNNLGLVIMTVSANALLTRINTIDSQIKIDQQRVLVFEGAILLQEGISMESDAHMFKHKDNIMNYFGKIRESTLIEKSDHIQVIDEYRKHWDAVNIAFRETKA